MSDQANARVSPRSDRVYLNADVARCEPGLHCPMRNHCGRYMAALPASGAIMMDGTSDIMWSPSFCPAYLPAADAVWPAPAPAPPKRHWSDPEK